MKGRYENGRVCLKAYDEFDHHSVTLRLAEEPGFDYAAFKVDSEETLERMAEAVEAFGYPTDVVPANTDQPGFGKRIGSTISTGHRLEIYAGGYTAYPDNPRECGIPNSWDGDYSIMREK